MGKHCDCQLCKCSKHHKHNHDTKSKKDQTFISVSVGNGTNKNTDTKYDNYDYIICGGGTAGCTVAEIISRNPKNRVLVLELGDRYDDNPIIKTSGAVSESDDFAEFFYQNAQQKQLKIPQNLRFQYTTGRLLGGGSSINGQQFVNPTDFIMNQWVKLTGDPIWNASNALSNFKEMTTFHGKPPSSAHGTNGPLGQRIEGKSEVNPIITIFANALSEVATYELGVNVPKIKDYNEMTPASRIGTFERWQLFENADGTRSSASNAFLTHKTVSRNNVDLVHKSNVIKVLFRENRAVGVLYNIEGQAITVFARKKVIVSMGIYSAALLMRSGIGDKSHLKSQHIPVVFNNPNVGLHLVNHQVTSATFGEGPSLPSNIIDRAAGDLYGGGGFLPTPNKRHKSSSSSSSSEPSPRRLQVIGIPLSNGIEPSNYIMATLDNQPQSTGFVRLQSNDPYRIVLSSDMIFSNPIDLETYKNYYKKIVLGMHKNRHFPYVLQSPTPEVISDDSPGGALEQFIGSTLSHAHHWTGSCRMGKSSKNSVCDGKGRVFGVSNLMVIDVSASPKQSDGNTAAPAFLIGYILGKEILAGRI